MTPPPLYAFRIELTDDPAPLYVLAPSQSRVLDAFPALTRVQMLGEGVLVGAVTGERAGEETAP